MAGRLKIGVIGGGTVSQVEHIPTLLRLRDKFDLVCVADPSVTTRRFIGEAYGIDTTDSAEDLLSRPLDAVLIASPDPLHAEQVKAALARQLHVFCEKPLCYALDDIDDIRSARDKAGKVVQVGYMKRYDPSYRAARAHLPGTRESLRFISVEVNDPGAEPFVRHHPRKTANDVDPELAEAVRRKQSQQIAAAVGIELDAMSFHGFAYSYCASLIHDINLVHGLLDALKVVPDTVVGAQVFAGGAGGHGSVRLLGGQALWTMTHLWAPGIPDYRERVSLYFDEGIVELEFPSPWLNHQPTRLEIRRGSGQALETVSIRSGFEEAFIGQLEDFWRACTTGAPVENSVEAAERDLRLARDLILRHVQSLSGRPVA